MRVAALYLPTGSRHAAHAGQVAQPRQPRAARAPHPVRHRAAFVGGDAFDVGWIVWASIAPASRRRAHAPRWRGAPNDLALELESAPREGMRWQGDQHRCWPRCTRASGGQRRFISDAAHQLHAAGGGWKSQTELALNEASEAVGPALRTRLQRVHERDAQRALVNQLLTLARAEPGIGGRAGEVTRRSAAPRGELTAEWVPRARRCRHRPRLEEDGTSSDAGGAGQRAAAARGHRQPDRQRDPLHRWRRPVTVRVRSLGP